MANTDKVLGIIGEAMDSTQKFYEEIRKANVSNGSVMGLLSKGYPFMKWHLNRNHWDGKSTYDGYGTPIGSASQLDYKGYANSERNNDSGRDTWSGDATRTSSPNYLEYLTKLEKNGIGNSEFEYMLLNPIKRGERVGAIDKYKESDYIAAYQKAKTNGNIPYTGLHQDEISNGGGTFMEDLSSVALGRTAVMATDQVDNDSNVGFLTMDNGKQFSVNSKDYNAVYKRRHHSSSYQYLNELTSNDNGDARGLNYVYAEPENGKTISNTDFSSAKQTNGGSYFANYEAYQVTDWDDSKIDDIITKTNKAFHADRNGRTIIGRFHTDKWASDEDDTTSTAWSKYGFSHGRNLLKIKPTTENGYDNPYCRVWTFHHQYSRLADCIRPFVEEEDGKFRIASDDDETWANAFRSKVAGFDNGGKRLFKKGVLNRANGLVNYSPSRANGDMEAVDPRNCMFSIENLAWKGVGKKSEDNPNGLSKEQRGPFGGRIMWFPPYNLSFNENVSVEWGGADFIGRGEKVYSYKNTNRTGNISFDVLIDHPEIMNEWENARVTDADSSVDNIESNEQTVLRFFAGCANLNVKDLIEQQSKTPSPNAGTPNDKGDGQHEVKIEYFLFYPNNYSGADDSVHDAWEYLMNGIGYGDIINDVAKERLEPNLYKRGVNYGVFDPSNKFEYKGNRIGGYEMWHSEGTGDVKESVGLSLDATIKDNDRLVISGILSDDGGLAYVSKDKKLDPRDSAESRSWTWKYRVDERTRHEILRKENYRDTKTYGLNSVNYQNLCKVFTDVDKKDLYSATEVYQAILDTEIDENCYDSERVNALRKIFDTHKVSRVESYGWASLHGYESSNIQLGKDRADTAMGIIKTSKYGKGEIKYERKDNSIGPVKQSESVSEFNPKVYRCARVIVYFESETTDSVTDIASEKATFTTTTDENGNVTTTNGETNILSSNNTTSTETKKQKTNVNWLNAESTKLGRYDNEGRFFQLLEIGNPFLYSKITEKVRHFSPAYHAVSPEGFNARLTFLHQCTRQGPTVGSSDTQNGKVASNLAFGRAPVCVLRIGDFFYTKVIITSLNIIYDKDGINWDLNHEGIGVMPMYAHIELGITFLGGSDLSGPISRLQNATSFNYYANTGVYDNRSDMVEYDSNGDIRKISVFNPQVDTNGKK